MSKREKLIFALMRTYVVTDNELLAINRYVDKQLLDLAGKVFNDMASLNDADREWCVGLACLTCFHITNVHATQTTN